MEEAEILHRLENLESQIRAITDHLKIVLIYSPQKYEVMTKADLEKTSTMPVSSK